MLLQHNFTEKFLSPPGDRALCAYFETFITEATFPCVGAKAAQARDQLDLHVAQDIRCPADDISITRALERFAASAEDDAMFTSFVVIFRSASTLTEYEFEQALWKRLQAMHELDARHYGWDEKVSSNPASAKFSMSIGGRGFYVIGLHPHASRPARRFAHPALVFNLHSQFERLRAENKFSRLSASIDARDQAYSGSRNPMLSAYGENSEARQYSGRAIPAHWVCPFHAIPRP